MTLKPGDKVTVKGWDGEVHTVDAVLQDTVVLRSDERVKVERCAPVKRPAKFPEDWGKVAEFTDREDDTRPHIDRIAGYNPNAGTRFPWISASDCKYKYCYIYEREQS